MTSDSLPRGGPEPILPVPATHLTWLRELTGLPTAAGREDLVVDWIGRWVEARPDLAMCADDAGNLWIAARDGLEDEAPLVITAHLDHPAFVLERWPDDRPGGDGPRAELTFRGGVRDPYFEGAAITLHPAGGDPVRARLTRVGPGPAPRRIEAIVDGGANGAGIRERLTPGTIGRWVLPAPELVDDRLHAPACDDLAAVAAALAALDRLRSRGQAGSMRLLLTRAEEVGFLGAIAVARAGTLPAGARVVTLECSRSFAESPLGAGPIVRVGDRTSTFGPRLTSAVASVAGELEARPGFRWQRRLMPGGTCESTVFHLWGHAATCVCLPLLNYHNMGRLEEVEAGDDRAAEIAREVIDLGDFANLVELLVAIADAPAGVGDLRPGIEARADRLDWILRGETAPPADD